MGSASKMALTMQKLPQDGSLSNQMGIVIGSSLGNFSETTDYFYEIIRLGVGVLWFLFWGGGLARAAPQGPRPHGALGSRLPRPRQGRVCRIRHAPLAGRRTPRPRPIALVDATGAKG